MKKATQTFSGSSQTAPASIVQRRFWFLNQLEPLTAAYNLNATYHITGPLNLTAVASALQQVGQRHATLRTTFQQQDDQPVQVIHRTCNVHLEQIDLSQQPKAVTPDIVWQRLQPVIFTPFDLHTGPLHRVTAVALDPTTHYLNITAHSIIADKQSLAILFQELAATYGQEIDQPTATHLPHRSHYTDFCRWQQAWLDDEETTALRLYWAMALAETPAAFKLTPDSDADETAVLTPPPQHTLTPQQVRQLTAVAHTHHTSLTTLLLATWHLLLHRLTGEEETIVGTTVSGRLQRQFAHVMGPFQNVLPIVAKFQPAMRFDQLLQQIEQTTAAALAHQALPFEEILETVAGIKRDINRHPLFGVTLNCMEGAPPPPALGTTAVRPITLAPPDAKLSLTLDAMPHDNGLLLQMRHRLDLFTPQRAQEILTQFAELLLQISANPQQPIITYSLVTAAARTVLPDPTAPLDTPRYPLVTDAFDAIAAQQPAHQAIRQNGRSWTYHDLHHASQQIARYLAMQGIQQGDVVAVLGLRSFGTIASMLGTFYSGGVLLPLDPSLPRGRQEIMVAIAKAKHLLYIGPYRGQDGWLPEVMPVTAVSSNSGHIQAAIPANTTLPTSAPENPAYLFYTSGSSGSPKGVLGSHQGLAHFLDWQRHTFDIGPQDRSAQLTSLSFDVVLRDIFTPLTAGATLCLPEQEERLSPSVVLPWLEKEQITLLHTVPSLAQTWLEQDPAPVTLQHLRLIFSAGEALTGTFVNRWRQAFPQSGDFINMYGPTETTLAKIYYRLPQPPLPGIQPIGYPLPHTMGLVVNQAKTLCGLGEPGEIVIRTPFRTLGYINASPEQAARFAPNPFNQDTADIVYFTGDRGRYRLDGSLEILGRLDQQVKIRGVRVDLEEVQHVIEQHSAVRQTAVLAREEMPGQKYLAAYIVPASDAIFDVAELQRYLRQRLTDAMVPTAMVIMASLPLTPNGKLDRRALPIPEHTQPERKRPLLLPRTDLEKQLVSIWEAVLKTRPIGVQDDFFALGGHSLLAVQLFTQIEKETGVNLPLATLFQESTIAHLAQLIAAQQSAGKNTWESLVTIQPEGNATPFFCIHGITGDILWFKELGKLFAPERPFMGLQSQGLDGVQTPFTDLCAMAHHYIIALKEKQPRGPYLLGGASFGGTLALEMAQQLQAQGDKVALLVILDHAPANVLPADSPLAQAPQFASNFARWLCSFVRLGPKRMWRRLRRKLRVWQASSASPTATRAQRPEVKAAHVIDYAQDLPEHRRRLIEINFQAIDSYKPRPYNGRVLLLKARSRPLFSQNDPVAVWQKLVSADQLIIHEVPGTHETIFTPPNVATLATLVKQALDNATQA